MWEWLLLLLYGALSAVAGGTHGFWRLALTGYIQWMMVNLGDLFFLDVWLIQKKTKNRFVILAQRTSGYEFKAWMKDYALPEHLLSGRFAVPAAGGGSRRDGTVIAEIMIRGDGQDET